MSPGYDVVESWMGRHESWKRRHHFDVGSKEAMRLTTNDVQLQYN